MIEVGDKQQEDPLPPSTPYSLYVGLQKCCISASVSGTDCFYYGGPGLSERQETANCRKFLNIAILLLRRVTQKSKVQNYNFSKDQCVRVLQIIIHNQMIIKFIIHYYLLIIFMSKSRLGFGSHLNSLSLLLIVAGLSIDESGLVLEAANPTSFKF